MLFHCVPWAKPSSYNVALALDFMAITGSVTSQIAAWTGPLSAATAVSAALSAATAALCWAGLRQAKQPLWQARPPASHFSRAPLSIASHFLPPRSLRG